MRFFDKRERKLEQAIQELQAEKEQVLQELQAEKELRREISNENIKLDQELKSSKQILETIKRYEPLVSNLLSDLTRTPYH